MTQRAIGWNAGCFVIRIGSLVVVGEVARSTIGRSPSELAADVALRTRDLRVHSGQGKLRCGMIKFRTEPRGC